MFKVVRVHVEDVAPKRFVQKIRFWDKAGTEGGQGAFTVGLLMGKDEKGHFWVLDVVRGRWDSSERENIIHKTAQADGRDVIIGIEQEPGSGGKESAENTVRRLAGYRVRVDRPSGSASSKELRADPYSVQVNNGNVYVVRGPWLTEYLSELSYFPHSKYKDQVDASSGAFNTLAKGKRRVGGMKYG